MATVEKRAVGITDFMDAGVDSPKMKILKKDNGSSSKQVGKSSEPELDSDTDSYDSDEYMLYEKQKTESECFDVDVEPRGVMSSFCVCNDLSKEPLYHVKECEDLARKAVLYHNLNKQPDSSNLEFVKVLKFNVEFIPIEGEMFYITFEAMDVKDGSVDFYQARVWLAYNYIHEQDKWELIPDVQMVRKRKDTPVIGQDPKPVTEGKSRSCGCGCHGSGPCSG